MAEVPRGELFICTKIPPTEQGEVRAYAAVLDSLKKLQLNYLDLCLIHWPGSAKTALDSESNVAQRQGTWNALVRLQLEGKVRHIGTSNFKERHLERLLGPIPAVNQVSACGGVCGVALSLLHPASHTP